MLLFQHVYIKIKMSSAFTGMPACQVVIGTLKSSRSLKTGVDALFVHSALQTKLKTNLSDQLY